MADVPVSCDGVGETSLFRVRLLLRFRKVARLHAHHAGALYALVARAYGLSQGVEPAVPDGLLLLVPEQCRIVLQPGEPYAFGFTLIAVDETEATRRVRTVVTGLRRIGREKPKPSQPFGGNFTVEQVQDIVAGRDLPPDALLLPIPPAHIEEEIAQARAAEQMTIRFLSPLRALRPKPDRRRGHTFMDRDCFPADVWVFRLQQRLENLGLPTASLDQDAITEAIGLRCNRLVWFDLAYGPSRPGRGYKSLDGAVGRVTLEIRDQRIVPMLVWGQYVHVGEASRFGHGRYRIEALGEDRFPCARAKTLLQLAVESPALDRLSAESDMASGQLRAAGRRMVKLDHRPAPPHKVTIHDPAGRPRVLSIPSPLDLALQRAVMRQLAPALDRFFEVSSFAFRKGLGRRHAAGRIRRAFRDGFRFAVRADFRSFFDTIDHRLMRERLEAYLADDQAVEMLMRWVRCGAPASQCGLPTGAPISPLLANLFLDDFDERIAREGGMLVRYADDFLILFRNKEQADRIFNFR